MLARFWERLMYGSSLPVAILYSVKGTIPTASKWIVVISTVMMLVGFLGPVVLL
jgi:hypothetical protein